MTQTQTNWQMFRKTAEIVPISVFNVDRTTVLIVTQLRQVVRDVWKRPQRVFIPQSSPPTGPPCLLSSNSGKSSARRVAKTAEIVPTSVFNVDRTTVLIVTQLRQVQCETCGKDCRECSCLSLHRRQDHRAYRDLTKVLLVTVPVYSVWKTFRPEDPSAQSPCRGITHRNCPGKSSARRVAKTAEIVPISVFNVDRTTVLIVTQLRCHCRSNPYPRRTWGCRGHPAAGRKPAHSPSPRWRLPLTRTGPGVLGKFCLKWWQDWKRRNC